MWRNAQTAAATKGQGKADALAKTLRKNTLNHSPLDSWRRRLILAGDKGLGEAPFKEPSVPFVRWFCARWGQTV